MISFVATVTEAARKRAAYRRTVTELENLPTNVAMDLNIDRGDVKRIAHRAVYGA